MATSECGQADPTLSWVLQPCCRRIATGPGLNWTAFGQLGLSLRLAGPTQKAERLGLAQPPTLNWYLAY